MRRTRGERLEIFATYQSWALLLATLALRRLPRWIRKEEVQSAALVGLWSSTERWDGQQLFPTFAQWRIRGAIKDYLRTLLPRGQGRQPLNLQIYSLEEDEIWQEDQTLTAVDETDEIRGLLRPLPERSRQVMTQYLHGRFLKDIGRDLDVSESMVSRIITSSVNELRSFWRNRE